MRRHHKPALVRHLATLAGAFIVASLISVAPVSLLERGPQAIPTVETASQPAFSYEAPAGPASPVATTPASTPTSQPTPSANGSLRLAPSPVPLPPPSLVAEAAVAPVNLPVPGNSLASGTGEAPTEERSGSLQSLSLELSEVEPSQESSPAPSPTPALSAAPAKPAAAEPAKAAAPATTAPTPVQAPPLAPPPTAATAAPKPVQPPSLRVGIQVGHWKNAELPEELKVLRGSTGAAGSGWTEVGANRDIAQRVAGILEASNIQVDLLPATVPVAYRADAFVAIHADANTDTKLSGYKAARARASAIPQKDDSLVNALREEYKSATGLPEHRATITTNMTAYYAFNNKLFKHSVHAETPSAIFETVFMTTPSDRQFIQQHPEKVAAGIAAGILKFLGAR